MTVPVVSYLPAEILDYVETHAPSGESTFGISQRELAKALGYHPCSMSRPLADLVGEGLLRRRRGVVRGGVRKQLVYELTEEGREKLEKQTKEVPLLSGDLPPPPNPFLGRKEELKELWDSAQGGGTVVFVEGPPGMGKTALVSRHVRRLKAGRIPFWFTVRPGSSPRHFATALARALASIGAQQLAYYAQLPRQPVGREVANLAQRALGDRELLAVTDDHQAATADMKRFLSEFVEGMSKDRHDTFYFVGQEGPFFQPASLTSSHLTLGGLDRAAAHELTDRRGGLADRFESVFQSTLGSPLLLQLAVSTPGVEATSVALPAAVVERMPAAEMVGLLPVALANEPLPLSFVREASGLTETRIDQLSQMGLLQTTLEGRLELLQVVRTAMVARAGAVEEKEAHLRLAAYYARSHRSESVRERFLHLVAGESWKVATQLLATQERTLLSVGYSDSLRNALRHMTLAMPRGPGRIRALRVEAAILRLHSEYSEAILSLRRAASESAGDERVEAECLMLIVELYVRLRQIDEADRALEEARRRGLSTKRLQILQLLSEARIIEARGDFPRAQALFEETFQFARRARVPDLALESIAAWSRLASLGGDQEAALKVVSDGLPDARQSGRMDIVFNLLLVRARAYAETGRKELAETEMRMIRVEAEALGYLNQLTYTLSGLAAMAFEGGRWAEAISYARQASTLAERLGNDTVLGHTLALMAGGEHRRGQLETARQHGERGVSVLSRLPQSDSLVIARSYLIEIYLDLHLPDLARKQYDEARSLAQSMGMHWWKDRLETEFGERMAALGQA